MKDTAILEAVPLPCILIAQSEQILAANTKAEQLLGPGLVGRNYVTMLRQPALLDAIEACLKGDQDQRHALYTTNDGAQDTSFQITCKVVPNGPRAVMVSFVDMTQMEQADQIRRDFVANVSHELRTPLTALMGFIETLRGPAKDDPLAQQRFLEIMDAEAGRMNRLVGDLLSLSRVEADQRVRPTHSVVIGDVLRSTLHSLRPLADEAGIALQAELEEGDLTLPGDPDQLRQVFTNLVDNAIKYGGADGPVTVRMTQIPYDPVLRRPCVQVQVRDEGPGLDPLHLPRLTERFYRVDTHRSRALGGTGLGLAIVKHILNRHRGRLQIDSELGQGSVFSVILPCDAKITTIYGL
ncbi:MAG: ATP-binding protein [Paracoccaceae bacterium]